jgi:membrane-associated protease RseP (regulator of RpoE activity)
MSFIVYDLIFLVLFAIFVSVFLYTRKKNLKREGLLFLYKTSWGIKLINKVGNKYKKTLKFLSYVSIGLGYCLMASVIYLFYTIVKIYVFRPDFVSVIKVPPIMPLIPYLPRIFKLNFLPEFNFTYWIIILAVIAISHEFAHGIFAVLNKVKIKTTGFGFFPFFLPVFLAAFVELDEPRMAKKSKFSQMAILSAGTFANVVVAILFFGILWLFFSLAFTPAGVVFDTYSYSILPVASITMINGISLENPSYEKVSQIISEKYVINIGEKVYDDGIAGFSKDNDGNYFIAVYDDTPAINAGLVGAINEINGVKINSRDNLVEELLKHSPNDEINIKTKIDGKTNEYKIVLEEHPQKEGVVWMGIGFIDKSRAGVVGKISSLLSSFKDPYVYYEPVFDGWSLFIYNLLWWLILISVSVALVNMLPVGIFDGGRFFYLTILALTGKEKIARKSFSIVTYFFLAVLVILMFFWVKSFF